MTTTTITTRTAAVRTIADMIRNDIGLTGEDIADIAAFVDYDTAATWYGPNPVLAATLLTYSDQLGESAADLVQSATHILGR